MVAELLLLVISGINEFGESGARQTAEIVKSIIIEKTKKNRTKLVYSELIGREINHISVKKKLMHVANYLKEPNRKAMIYYNGHGNQTRDTNSDEADGKDEYWSLMGGGIMLDDEISLIFNSINEDSFLFMVSDCCSSGTMIDRSLNNRPWILLSSSQDNQDSLASSSGGIFTQFGLIPAIKQYDTIKNINDYIQKNIDIPTQTFRLEVTRNSLLEQKLF